MSEAAPEQVSVGNAGGPAPFDAESVIAELDRAFDYLPEAAIREARAHRDEMVPRLIEAIRDATAKVRAGKKAEGNARFFALFLLAELRAKEAAPAILEAVSLPGEGPFDLFGDAITSSLAGILVALSDEPLALIDGLIGNKDLNEYVRWQAADAYLYVVKSGRLRREQAVEHLRQHLRREMDRPDENSIVSNLVSTLDQLAPKEAYEEIEDAFGRGMVDELLIGLEEIDRSIAEGESGVQRNLDHLRVVNDTIEELRSWASFGPKAAKPAAASWPGSLSSGVRPASSLPLSQPVGLSLLKPAGGKRVGRNEPCPCGSGKKYKKCCGWNV